MVNAFTPLIVLSFLSTRGSGWDHSTQAIILLHRDRWSRGGLSGGLGFPHWQEGLNARDWGGEP